ncbi:MULTISPECIES: MAE_28990/MAE_18760 family HEPN-like nuclease [unclassified Bacillus (in: firmicutes)]|uniref:MAE_28990/MAE_18760 family HEPN-like nuclease n=1 Tax=unclassified Bacillus (in: firmicutes) TaxID=185979 RepID=UPI0033659733
MNSKQQFIDRQLLKTRNEIAHGEYKNLVDKGNDDEAKKDFEELYHTILELMDEFKEQIIDAGLKKTYLKVSS